MKPTHWILTVALIGCSFGSGWVLGLHATPSTALVNTFQMKDWLSTKVSDQTFGHQFLLEGSKALLAFLLLLVVTRWTLARADRKDMIARSVQANLRLQERRMDLLADIIVRVAEIWDMSVGIMHLRVNQNMVPDHGRFEPRIRELLGEIKLLGERYGEAPPDCLWKTEPPNTNQTSHLGEALHLWTGKYFGLMFHSKTRFLYSPHPDEDEAVLMAMNEARELQMDLRRLFEHEEALLVSASRSGANVAIRRPRKIDKPIGLLESPSGTRNLHLVKKKPYETDEGYAARSQKPK